MCGRRTLKRGYASHIAFPPPFPINLRQMSLQGESICRTLIFPLKRTTFAMQTKLESPPTNNNENDANYKQTRYGYTGMPMHMYVSCC